MMPPFIRVTKCVWRDKEEVWSQGVLYLATDNIQNFGAYELYAGSAMERKTHFPVTRIRLRKPLDESYDDRKDRRAPMLWLTVAMEPSQLAALLEAASVDDL